MLNNPPISRRETSISTISAAVSSEPTGRKSRSSFTRKVPLLPNDGRGQAVHYDPNGSDTYELGQNHKKMKDPRTSKDTCAGILVTRDTFSVIEYKL